MKEKPNQECFFLQAMDFQHDITPLLELFQNTMIL